MIQEPDDASWDESMRDLTLEEKWRQYLEPIFYEEQIELTEVCSVSETLI